jgi:L,D-transpeptidase catalytic domain
MKLNTEPARRFFAMHIFKGLFGNVCLVAVGATLAMTSSAALARTKAKHRHEPREAAHVNRGSFGDIPKGPLQIFISIEQQELHLYADGKHVADALVATGVPGHLTPLGVFNVIGRDRYHHSNIYDNAPMPYMQRITWSGVALHEGPGVGHEASHGCIRMPQDFAVRLWQLHTMGMGVIIARPELQPTEFADAHLFVHKDRAPVTASMPRPVVTAQAIPPGTRTDAILRNGAKSSQPAPAGGATLHADTAVTEPTPAAAMPAAVKLPTKHQEATKPEASAIAASKPAMTAAAAQAVPPNSEVPPQSEAAAIVAPNLTAPVNTPPLNVPLPLSRPARLGDGVSHAPIAIYISRKTGRIYVRQNFSQVFDAPVTIENPKEPIGTHVFTALDYLPDRTTLRWDVASLPGEATKVVEHWKYARDGRGHRRRERVTEKIVEATPPPDSPHQALARIEIPQDVINQISQMIAPGSSLIISDQGLGEETGEGTNFIVVTR